ncbi:MAG: AbrB/MazE/SpoVT family DNA-binding domain-containing protein [Kangiella sp.]|nr:MAG: AbrB/MazE/SpoVT family DNA-binding domain-containing protein [Kangiella sp.]
MDKEKLSNAVLSQTVCLPKASRLVDDEVRASLDGNKAELEELASNWDSLLNSLEKFPDDFMKHGRMQPKIDE